MSRPHVIRSNFRLAAALAAGALGLQAGAAAAQPAPYFSPTYAASEGSPYKEIYSQAFGASGPPPQAPLPQAPPLETAAPPPGPPPDTVYVIENGQLLSYSAEDYAKSGGRARQQSPLPAPGSPLGAPDPQLPTIARQFYGKPPAN